MTAEQQLGSWTSGEYVAEWAGEDVLADMLTLPRQISAALLADSGIRVDHVVDVGAGPGAYLRVLLDAFPNARGTWVDSSEPMEELARERLHDLEDRITYVRGDAERLESVKLEPATAIVTSRMLHHFSPDALRRFYGTVYAQLVPGGFFFNLDHFGTPNGWEQRYRRIREQFTGPRKRPLKPHRHDYPLMPVDGHLELLRAAGFESPDVPWKTFYTALLAAQKRS